MNKRGKQVLLFSLLTVLIIGIISVFTIYIINAAEFSLIPQTSTTFNEDTTTLINLSIINANVTANITYVNITMPNGFVLDVDADGTAINGTDSLSAFSNLTNGSSVVLEWKNATAIILNATLVGGPTGNRTNYFWFNVTVATPGAYNLTIDILDIEDIANQTVQALTVSDTTVPTASLLGPANGSSYVDTDIVTFRCNATDTFTLSNITLSIWPASGSAITNVSSSVQTQTYGQFNFTHTLDPGDYLWSCYGNDSTNNVNSSWATTNRTLTISTFGFTGNVKNTTGNMQNVNVTIYAKAFGGQGPPATISQYSTTTDSNGNYTLSGINFSNQMFYQVTFIKNESDGNASWIGPTLPPFPAQPFFKAMSNPFGAGPAIGPFFNATTVYMQQAANIKLYAINSSGTPVAQGGAINFTYMVSDQSLGFPISEPNFNSLVYNATIVVPLNRSYSIMFMPQESPPITIEVTPSSYAYDSSSGTYFTNITANTTISMVQFYGWLNTTNSSSSSGYSINNFTNLSGLNFMIMPGNMASTSATMPNNIGQFFGGAVDNFDATNGFFNITLPGTTSGMDVMIGLYASNGTIGAAGTEYFAGFYNFTVAFGQNNHTVNLTLQPLAGQYASSTFGFNQNLSTRYTIFNITDPAQNKSAGEAFTEIETTYGGITIKWLLESASNTGTLKLPLLNNTEVIVNIYGQNFAPLRRRIKAENVNSTAMVEIPLYASKAETPDGFDMKNFIIPDFLVSNSTCDNVTVPDSCRLMNFSSMEGFNPLKLMLGGSTSVRLIDKVTNIVVHYVNVDLLASGPPVDAAFDRNASSSSLSSSALSQAWRFGAMGPSIYDSIIVGIPYNASVNEAWGYNISLDYLYDDDWNVIWNISANTTAEIPSYYADYDSTWFTAQGMPCSKTNSSADCYMDTTTNYFWVRIPHFSRNGLGISGATATSSSSSSSSSGGGGGGAVHTKKHSWSRILANTENYVKVNDYVIGIYGVSLAVSEEATNAKITISTLASRPSTTAENKSNVYKYLSIDTTNLDKLSYGVVQSMVQKLWLSDNGVAYDDVILSRWDTTDSKWQELPTEKVKEDLIYVYYNSTTTSFSYFKIAEKETGVEEAAEEEVSEGEEKAEEGVQEKIDEIVEAVKSSRAYYLWFGILATAVIIAVVIFLIQKLQKEKKKK